MAASGSSLTGIFGVSEVLAAKILGQVGDVARFPSAAHFASHAGTAPVEASSGDVRRHRLNRAGDRALDTASHLVARCQLDHETAGRGHHERKLAEAKSAEEALRSPKCRLAKVVYRRLRSDRHRLPAPVRLLGAGGPAGEVPQARLAGGHAGGSAAVRRRPGGPVSKAAATEPA